MNQLTVFGDIHANLPALEAALDVIDARNLDNLYCLGDLVGYGVWPNEGITAVRQRHIPTIMGNDGVGQVSGDCGCAYKTPEAQALGERSIAWSNAHSSAENKAYLRELVAKISLQLGKLALT